MLVNHLVYKVPFFPPDYFFLIFPIGVTLANCWIGPQKNDEEKSSMKVEYITVRVCPWKSLARGRVVLEMFLVRPNIRAVQGPKYTWHGLPKTGSFPEDSLAYRYAFNYPILFSESPLYHRQSSKGYRYSVFSSGGIWNV